MIMILLCVILMMMIIITTIITITITTSDNKQQTNSFSGSVIGARNMEILIKNVKNDERLKEMK